MRGGCTSFVLLLMLSLGSVAEARRLPEPGGEVRIALPVRWQKLVKKAHQRAPLLEPLASATTARRLAYDAFGDVPPWRSSLIEEPMPSVDSVRWTIHPRVDSDVVQRALTACLKADSADAGWPSEVLRVARVTVEIKRRKEAIVLAFSRPIGPLFELLSGCGVSLGPENASSGPFRLGQDEVLEANQDSLVPLPLVERVVVVGEGVPANIRIGDERTPTGGDVVVAPFPDVIVLLQDSKIRTDDPLGLMKDSGRGLGAFYQHLSPRLLISVYARGRGVASRSLLPPGIAPPRPLPISAVSKKAAPLALRPLPDDAPRVMLTHPGDDFLVQGLVERIGLMMRSRGLLLESGTHDGAAPTAPMRVVRWRSPTTDPGLALLHFVAAYDSALLPEDLAELDAHLNKLLSPSHEERIEGALVLERAWLAERRVIPLVSADFWVEVDPGLKDVRLRPDGVVVLTEAFWSPAP